MLSQRLREDGEYLGFSEELGYVYKLNGRMYSFSTKGIIDITYLDVAL